METVGGSPRQQADDARPTRQLHGLLQGASKRGCGAASSPERAIAVLVHGVLSAAWQGPAGQLVCVLLGVRSILHGEPTTTYGCFVRRWACVGAELRSAAPPSCGAVGSVLFVPSPAAVHSLAGYSQAPRGRGRRCCLLGSARCSARQRSLQREGAEVGGLQTVRWMEVPKARLPARRGAVTRTLDNPLSLLLDAGLVAELDERHAGLQVCGSCARGTPGLSGGRRCRGGAGVLCAVRTL